MRVATWNIHGYHRNFVGPRNDPPPPDFAGRTQCPASLAYLHPSAIRDPSDSLPSSLPSAQLSVL